MAPSEQQFEDAAVDRSRCQELVVGGGHRVQPGPNAIVVELSWACRDRMERPRAVWRGGRVFVSGIKA